MSKDDLKFTADNDFIIFDTCNELILEIKSTTKHFLTFTCASKKDHQGDHIINLSWGDIEIEIKKKREADRYE